MSHPRRFTFLGAAPIGSLLIADLAGPSAEVIQVVNVLVIFPIFLGRVRTLDAHAARHGHYRPVRLRFCAVGDRQRDACVVKLATKQVNGQRGLNNRIVKLERALKGKASKAT